MKSIIYNKIARKVFLTMAATNSIFTTSGNTKAQSVYKLNKYTLDNGNMSMDEEKLFNTYRYWNPFYAPLEDVIEGGDGKDKIETKSVSGLHTKALFSRNNAVPVYNGLRVDANMPLLDNPESRKTQRENMACTIKDLVDASRSGKLGRQTYTYADFAYCKYLGKVSNNYLITLRRFASPCGDKIDKRTVIPGMRAYEDKMQNHLPDIGHMVTWLGTPGNEMSNILKYTYHQRWKKEKSQIEEVTQGEAKGPLAGIFNMASSKYRKQVMQGRAGTNFVASDSMNTMLGGGENFSPPYPPETYERMANNRNKAYGPVDSIDEVYKREIGLEFEHKISLTFDYELRSYYGVNGKAAMLDLLSNILACTYAHGTWWGGATRFIGAGQDNIYANLPIFKLAAQGKLNDPAAIYEATIASINDGAKSFSNGVKGETTMDKIKNLAKDLGGMLLGGLLNKLGRPEKQAVAALLSGAPTGCWHLTVGNPKSPIIEVGNLICENVELEHYGPLGLDDFPTGLRVKVSLTHGKARDLAGIEKMYGRGDTRIYTPMASKVLDMYTKASSVYKSDDLQSLSKIEIVNPTTTEDLLKQVLPSIDAMSLQLGADNSKEIDTIDNYNDSFMSLKQHFEMTPETQIITAAEEAFQGAGTIENNKKQNA